MTIRRKTVTPIALLACVLLTARAAHADGLRIETIEDGGWAASVERLQKDLASEGRVVHVIVRDAEGTRLRCGTYAIALESAGAEAFNVVGCDDQTNSTAVRLVRRAALFEHGDTVSKPREPRIVASRTQTGAASGGAKNGAESAVDCTVTVHPFVRDLENGSRVELTPGRYAMRLKDGSGAEARPVGDGWTLVAPRGTHSTVEYFVYDTHKNEVVLNDRVTMNCDVHTTTGSGVLPDAPQEHAVESSSTPPPESPDKVSTPSSWQGHALTAHLVLGSAMMRTNGLQLANSSGVVSASDLGLHDSGGPVMGIGVSYERPGIYGSLTGTGAMVPLQHTLWNFSATSVVAAALHLGDTALYLGPSVTFGTYQATATGSQSLGYAARPAFTAGGAAGVRFHVRDDRTGKVKYVLGGELVAPIAGQAPWFVTASIALGEGR